MSRVLDYTVAEADLPCTLGGFLRRQGYSEKLLTRLRLQDRVRVNGAFHRMIDPVAPADRVRVTLPEEEPPLVPNPRLRLPVLYEDADLLVVDKPPDMLVHPAGRGFDDAVANFCAARYPGQKFRPIGRLDRNTTGAVLAAKSELAAALLTGRVEKEYFALAEGLLRSAAGLIDLPLLRVPGPTIQRRVDPAGQPSRTRYQVLRYLPELGPRGHSWLRLELLTGRTHQIRAHLSALGHPLAGDALYGGSTAYISRQALHCGTLRFCQPITGAPLEISAPLPEDMAVLLAEEA